MKLLKVSVLTASVIAAQAAMADQSPAISTQEKPGAKANNQQSIDTALRQFDKNQDGALNKQELREYMNAQRNAISGQSESSRTGDKITVNQKPAQVTIDQKPAQVTVKQPKPEVTITTQDPDIQVDQPEPQVSVDQADPKVRVSAGEPAVDVRQRDPDVSVRQQEPSVAVEQREAEFETSHLRNQRSTESVNRTPLFGVALSELESVEVEYRDGQAIGEVHRVLLSENGNEAVFLIRTVDDEPAVLPAEETSLESERLVVPGPDAFVQNLNLDNYRVVEFSEDTSLNELVRSRPVSAR